MVTLTEAVASAESETDPSEYVRLVKDAVIASVEEVDDAVSIKDTGYFNHSAVPDLVLRWSGRTRAERPLYLRRSFEEMEAGHDVSRLADAGPVFLSVGPQRAPRRQEGGDDRRPAPESDREAEPDADREAREEREYTESRLEVEQDANRRVLVTTASTLDRFSETAGSRSRSPLAGAVASQLLPAGRGLIDASRADVVLGATTASLQQLVGIFSEEALASVSNVAQLVTAALGGDIQQLALDESLLSLEEAGDILPWALTSPEVVGGSAFWQEVARRVNIKMLEQLAEALDGIDLNPLCRAGLDYWTPRAGLLGAAVPDEAGKYRSNPQWMINRKLLTLEVGDAAFRFASYGQAAKALGKVSSATWETIRPRIEAELRDIRLRGIARSIRLSAEESTDVSGDADNILASVSDRYYVDEVTLRYGLRTEGRDVRVSLGDQTALNSGPARLRDMLNALASVAAYRDPVSLDGVL